VAALHRRENALGLTDYDLLPKEQADTLRANDQLVLQQGRELLPFEEKALLQGREQIFSSVKFPLFDNEGEIYALGGISTNITEIRMQEQKLRDLQAKVEKLRARLEALEPRE
jgi:hypothetical protein